MESDPIDFYYIFADGRTIAMVTTGSESHTRYLHHDHLGSINTITDANRNIIEQRSFDAFGRVRQADWGNTLPYSLARSPAVTPAMKTSALA